MCVLMTVSSLLLAGPLSLAPAALLPAGDWGKLGTETGPDFDRHTCCTEGKAAQVGLGSGCRTEGT